MLIFLDEFYINYFLVCFPTKGKPPPLRRGHIYMKHALHILTLDRAIFYIYDILRLTFKLLNVLH